MVRTTRAWKPGLVLLAVTVAAGTAGAITTPGEGGSLAAASVSSERLRLEQFIEPLGAVEGELGNDFTTAWQAFMTGHGGAWMVSVDRRSGRIELAEGSGVPWVPGHGNALRLADIAAYTGGGEPTLAAVEAMARDFVAANRALFGVAPSHLALRQGASGKFSDYLWFVEFQVMRDGLPIEGATIVLRVNNGNLIQFGAEGLPPDTVATPRFALGRDEALVALSQYVGGLADGRDWLLDPGSRHLLPVRPEASRSQEDFVLGAGYELMAVWQFVLKRKGEPGTYRARVDATTGDVIELRDINAYASATGGVYPISFVFGNEVEMPTPFLDVPPDGYTDSGGQYVNSGGAVTSHMNGEYVRINDTCGSISLTSDGDGNLAFGASAGTDCVTPGTGGSGNTHSSRMQYYHTNRIAEKARAWLPANTWVQNQLTVNVNLNQTCNAYWNGSTTNFFRSGSGCGNTGEIAGVSLHEWGHGMDSNDGNGASPDGGTGETYGDFTGSLQTHDSCVGNGFLLSGNCSGYGDACLSCSGVRDIDWGQHVSNTPHTVSNFTRTRCGGGWCTGPCGQECHCESYPSSEALWDLAELDLLAGTQTSNPAYPDMDGPYASLGASWAVVDRLWYLTRPTARSAFVCNTSGNWSSNGCGSGNYWKVFRAIDDDDGNLDNGTPHSCYLYAAFDRHAIACPSDPGANTCFEGCTPPSAPVLASSTGNSQVQLTWNNVGAGVVYDVFRNEQGCDAGFTKIAEDVTGTSFVDDEVANFYSYYYQVSAQPTGNEACSSSPSNCVEEVPIPCIPPDPPAGVSAVANGDNRIDVSWSAVPDVLSYHVYRSRISGGPFAQIGTVPTGTLLWADTTVSGDIPYYYHVTAEDDCDESEPSDEVTATTTGDCTLPPVFDGLVSVTNPALATCTLELDWDAAAAECDGPVSYSVYRSTDPGFTPDPGNRIASDLTATDHVDDWELVTHTTYYYIVRATDQGNGSEDDNMTVVSAMPTGTVTIGTWSDDAGDTGTAQMDPMSPWSVAATGGHDGPHVYQTGSYGDDLCSPLTTPTLHLGSSAQLSFWSRHDIESGWDKGEVQISDNDGASWQRLEVGYPGSSTRTSDECGLPTGTYFTGSGLTWAEYTVPLNAWADQDIQVRWVLSTDGSVNGTGWWVDDITLTNVEVFGECSTVTEPGFFEDGFESGDTTMWSATHP